MKKISDIVEGTYQTTTDVQQTLCLHGLPSNGVVDWRASVIGISADYGDYAIWTKCAACISNNDNPTVVGAVDLIGPKKSLGATTWGLIIDTSGTDLRFRITGANGITINWRYVLRLENHFEP